jgi:hypothetical protein
MFELLALGIAGASGVYGHIKSRKFVGQRLRYTKLVEKPALGLFAGVGATVVAAPLVAVVGAVPLLGGLVGAGTAIAVGAGVGTGVALGVKDSKEPPKLIDD